MRHDTSIKHLIKSCNQFHWLLFCTVSIHLWVAKRIIIRISWCLFDIKTILLKLFYFFTISLHLHPFLGSNVILWWNIKRFLFHQVENDTWLVSFAWNDVLSSSIIIFKQIYELRSGSWASCVYVRQAAVVK